MNIYAKFNSHLRRQDKIYSAQFSAICGESRQAVYKIVGCFLCIFWPALLARLNRLFGLHMQCLSVGMSDYVSFLGKTKKKKTRTKLKV